MMKDFQALPKVELHLHLDCSLSYAVVNRLAPSISREQYDLDFIAPPKCKNLAEFLKRAPQGFALMQTETSLRQVTFDLFEQLASDHVIYAEIRFAPLLHTQKGLRSHEVVEIVDQAFTEAIQQSGIEARLILCTLRHFNEQQSLETVRLVERFRPRLVAGFDIAADEAGYPIHAHVSSFQYAITKGLPRTAHAGEARGPESVWETLKNFRPSRLGHGVRSIEDSALIAHLQNSGIHLEICPTCNIQTDIYNLYPDHPIDRLYRAGVSVGVNTDARTISNVTLTEEYGRLHHNFGWDKEQFLACNRNAINASFAPDSIKQKITEQLLAAYQS